MGEQTHKTILVAGVGLSPAVLTNTVWALAHECTPIIPDEVVAITTVTGRGCITGQLISSNAWNRLFQALENEGLPVAGKLAFGSSDSIRILGNGKYDFDDIATPEQNDASADFILKVLRQYTEDPATRVIASIAGGRKSMSALMISCMSLLGREQDRACHVLVNEPYEQRMEPPFLFPEKGVKHNLGGKNYLSNNAMPLLSDIPFVRVRGWYEREFRSVPPSYMQLVNQVQGIAPKPANYPIVKVDAYTGTLKVGTNFIPLSPSEFTLVYLMIHRIKQNRLPASWYDLESDFSELLSRKIPTSVNWFHSFRESGSPDPEDFRKWASSTRSKLRKSFADPTLADMLLPSMKKRSGHIYPADKIKIREIP
ncbi:CRISPR-associated ring nuclease Csm6 [Pontiellaceae bacterium B12227]|nr:CRISPR-associated ring nuclease Csm6 [Pontiellaceae bacterium B12227]